MTEATVALTLTCPWASIVIDGPKDIENRGWMPPAWLIGKTFAIHAGLKYSDEDWLYAQSIFANLGINPIDAMETWKNWKVRGAIIGTAVLAGYIVAHNPGAGVNEQAIPDAHNSKWFFGAYGWLLTDRCPLPEPIPVRGAQKLWDIGRALRNNDARGRPRSL